MSLKLGHYMKIPPRNTFLSQYPPIQSPGFAHATSAIAHVIGTVVALLIQTGVQQWLFSTVPDICQPHAPNGLTCDGFGVYFSGSVIWYVSFICSFHSVGSSELRAINLGAFLDLAAYLAHIRVIRPRFTASS